MTRRAALAMIACLAILALSLWPEAAYTQGVATSAKWPSKSLRVVVGYAPGGTSDVSARVLGEALGKAFGQTVQVENRPGAFGRLATEAVINAPPDGYTLLLAPESALMLPAIRPEMGIDVEKRLTPVTVVTSQPIVLVAGSTIGVRTVAEFITWSRGQTTSVNYATPGLIGTQNIAGEMFFRAANVRATNVPYKGGGQAVQDLLGGQVPVAMLGSAPVMPHLQAGRVVLLAVTSGQRAASLPQVPTLAESGFPQIDLTQWFGVLVPAGTPADVIARLSGEINRALADPGVRQRLSAAALDPVGGTPEQFAARLKSETAAFAKAVKEYNLQVQ